MSYILYIFGGMHTLETCSRNISCSYDSYVYICSFLRGAIWPAATYIVVGLTIPMIIVLTC